MNNNNTNTKNTHKKVHFEFLLIEKGNLIEIYDAVIVHFEESSCAENSSHE